MRKMFGMIRRLQAENQEVLAEIQRKKDEQEAARQEELRRQMEDEANTCTRCGRKMRAAQGSAYTAEIR